MHFCPVSEKWEINALFAQCFLRRWRRLHSDQCLCVVRLRGSESDHMRPSLWRVRGRGCLQLADRRLRLPESFVRGAELVAG